MIANTARNVSGRPLRPRPGRCTRGLIRDQEAGLFGSLVRARGEPRCRGLGPEVTRERVAVYFEVVNASVRDRSLAVLSLDQIFTKAASRCARARPCAPVNARTRECAMDLAGYVALTRQSGLANELQSVANNIANLSTTGYRREGVIFAEWSRRLPTEGGSVAMTEARARYFDELQGALGRDRRHPRPRHRGRRLLHRADPRGRAADPRRRLHPQRRRHRSSTWTATRCSTRAAARSPSPSRRRRSAWLVRRHRLSVDGGAGGPHRPRDRRGPDRALPRGRRALPRRGRHRAGRERPHRPGLPRTVERERGRPRWRA